MTDRNYIGKADIYKLLVDLSKQVYEIKEQLRNIETTKRPVYHTTPSTMPVIPDTTNNNKSIYSPRVSTNNQTYYTWTHDGKMYYPQGASQVIPIYQMTNDTDPLYYSVEPNGSLKFYVIRQPYK